MNYKDKGLVSNFLEELENFYGSLMHNPHAYSYFKDPVRQGKISPFPYLVVYEIIESTIVVYGVFMSKQDPDKKKKS